MPLRSGRFGFTLDVDVEQAASEITLRRWPAVALRFAYIVGLIALAWFGGHPSMNLTANHPATTATVLVGVGLVLAAVTVHAPPRHYVSGGWKPRWLVPFLVAGGIGPGYGWIMGHEQRQPGRMLYDYCAYGSVSHAQLDGCMEHVKLSHIDQLDTPAARFARGATDVCGAGSGPYCQGSAEAGDLLDQMPPPGQ